jgi:hypothetical protein
MFPFFEAEFEKYSHGLLDWNKINNALKVECRLGKNNSDRNNESCDGDEKWIAFVNKFFECSSEISLW